MSDAAGGGLLDSLRRLLATLLALAATRLELVTTELEEEMHRLARLLLWSMASLLAATLALLFAGVTVLVACWESHRLAAAGGLTALFALVAASGWYAVRRQMRERPALLAATRDELERDRAALGQGSGKDATVMSQGDGPGEGL